MLTFAGASSNKDKERDDPKGYVTIEFAYSLLARDVGIEI